MLGKRANIRRMFYRFIWFRPRQFLEFHNDKKASSLMFDVRIDEKLGWN